MILESSCAVDLWIMLRRSGAELFQAFRYLAAFQIEVLLANLQRALKIGGLLSAPIKPGARTLEKPDSPNGNRKELGNTFRADVAIGNGRDLTIAVGKLLDAVG
jgi:hypothetical protein